jgi:hypothetical protein
MPSAKRTNSADLATGPIGTFVRSKSEKCSPGVKNPLPACRFFYVIEAGPHFHVTRTRFCNKNKSIMADETTA